MYLGIEAATERSSWETQVPCGSRGRSGRSLEQWLTDSSLHICPVCSRLISTQDQTVLSLMSTSLDKPISSSWNDFYILTHQTWTNFFTLGSRSGRPRNVCPMLHGCLNKITSNKDTEAWTDFLCLPKPVLRRERRGRQNSKGSSNDMRRMCEQLLGGGGGTMWQYPRARHCMAKANSGTTLAGIVAVVPFGNGDVFSRIPHPLHPSLLHPGLRSPEILSRPVRQKLTRR